MKARTTPAIPPPRVLVTTEELAQMLALGKDTAIKLGNDANARRTFGRQVRWDVNRVREFTYAAAEDPEAEAAEAR